jgi:hypothetical protein
MAISFVGRGVTLSAQSSNVSNSIPSNVQAGDLFIGALGVEREDTTTPTIRVGSENSLSHRQRVNSSRSSIYLFMKLLSAGDITSGIVAFTNSGQQIARVGVHLHHMYFRGDIPTNLNDIDINNFSAPPQDTGTDATNRMASGNITAPGTTTPTTWTTTNYPLGSMFVGLWHHRNQGGNPYSLTPSTGWSNSGPERTNKSSSGLVTFITPSSGSLGSYVATVTQGGANNNTSIVLGIPLTASGPVTHTGTGSASATFGDTAPTATAEVAKQYFQFRNASANFTDTPPSATEEVAKQYLVTRGSSATFADSAPTASATVVTTFTETPSASATFSTVSVSAEVSFPGTGTASATFADTAPTATNTIEFTVYTESVGASATLTSVDAVFTVSFAEPGSAGATFSTPSVSTSIVQGLAVGFTASGNANGSGAVIPVSASASALFPARQTSALTTFTRPASAGAAATITAPLAGVTSNVPIVEQVFTATVTATGSRQFTGTASASLEVKGTTQTPESSVSRKAEVFCFVTLATDTQDVMKVSASTSVSAKYNIDIVTPVSSTVTVGTSHDGGVSNYSREASAGLNILASVDQSSGSVTNASAVIDGFGSIKGPLSAIRNFTAIIDAKGSIGANLLLGADIVTITEIWNVALVELGIATVSENDSSPQAQLLSNVWNGGFRQQFLADHAFHGAKTTKSLSLFTDSSGNAVKPSGNRWSNAYELPTDYIRALTINGLAMQPNTSMGQNAWEIEIVSDGATVPTLKRCLLSNEGSVSLEYIMDIGNSNISLLSPLVAHACGLALAAHVATNFGKNPSEQQQLNQKAQDALLAAKGVDGQESSPRMFSTTSLLDVRR